METVSKTGIHWLDETGASQDPATVGGKAASLSQLTAKFTVPPGFCVTGTAVAGEPVLPVEHVAAAYRALSERRGRADVAVAVRSSGVDEDGTDASFAGQNETFLNVRGADAVLAAVRDCVASFGSERARAYRRQHGLADTVPRFSVLVQELVSADVAGVAFSVNPVTSDLDNVVINASWGLGESIVGGTVTPDTYTFDTRSGEVHLELADKQRMTVTTEQGTEEVGVPERLRTTACLDDSQVRATARLAIDLKESMGWPVDIEFAWAEDELFLLQCRPVTTLKNRDEA